VATAQSEPASVCKLAANENASACDSFLDVLNAAKQQLDGGKSSAV
jgi:hypothetical protein